MYPTVGDSSAVQAVTSDGSGGLARADANMQIEDCDEQEDDVVDSNDLAEFDAPNSSLAAKLDGDEWDKDEEHEVNVDVLSDERDDVINDSSVATLALDICSLTTSEIATLRNRMKKIFTWEKMVSYLAICGRAPFSTEQYNFLTSVLSSRSQDPEKNNVFQDYKTVRRHMQTCLADWCFPKNSIYFVDSVARPRGTSKTQRVQTVNAGNKPAQSCVRIVWPTSWAKLDVATYTFYSDVFEHPRNGHADHLSIENAPVVHSRAAFIGRNPTLWVWFNGVPCIAKAGDTVVVPLAGRPVEVDRRRHVRNLWIEDVPNEELGYTSDAAKVVYCGTWIVGSLPRLGETRQLQEETWNGLKQCTLSIHERALYNKLTKASPNSDALDTVLEVEREGDDDCNPQTAKTGRKQTRLTYSTNVIQVYPGDQCVLFRAADVDNDMRAQDSVFGEMESTQHCVLIGSPVRRGLGLSAERLVWVDVDSGEVGTPLVSYVGSSNVIDMPTWLSGRDGTPHEAYENRIPSNTGYMPDGTRYVIYRFALYMDGFKQTKSKRDTRSVGGCYIMPLGLSIDARRSSAAPHVVSLASSSLPHNKVLKLVMDEICSAARTGVRGVDPYGRPVHIFLDPVSFFGDYPAAAECADTIGHTGNAFCTHCTVSKKNDSTGSRILPMTMNHSRRVGFSRSDERLNSIRQSPLQKELLTKIGMKSKDTKSGMKLPLVYLSSLCRAAKPERNEHGEDVVPMMFESSLSCAAVPDHMFNGLIKNVLNVAFEALPTNIVRRRVEKIVSSTARENGLPITGHLLRWSGKGEYKGIQNQTMTGFMCILLSSAPAFESLYVSTKKRAYGLVRSLQVFAAAVYFWPSVRLDGETHSHMFTVEGKIAYYAKLHTMAKQYLSDCDKVMEEDNEAGAILDKPNAHRAMELVLHTIPTFGHARNCSEMVLELMHQVFKQWLEKNTHQNAHISAVERALTRDWMGRVSALYKIWEHGDSRERACSEIGLRRLIMGEESWDLDERQVDTSELLKEFRARVQSTLAVPNANTMSKCAHVTLPKGRYSKWMVHPAKKLKDEQSADFLFARANIGLVCRIYRFRRGYEHREMTMYKAARLRMCDKFEGVGVSYKYNELVVGSVLSVVCDDESDGEVICDDEFKVGTQRFFAVRCIFEVSRDSKLWVMAHEMLRTCCRERKVYKVSKKNVFLIELGPGVRRVGAAHLCDEGCTVSPNSMDVRHSAGVLSGGLYEVWSREDGFPPYMG